MRNPTRCSPCQCKAANKNQHTFKDERYNVKNLRKTGRDEQVGDHRSACGLGPRPLELASPSVGVEAGRPVLGPSQRWRRGDAVRGGNRRRGKIAVRAPCVPSVAGCNPTVAERARPTGHGRRRVRRARVRTVLHGRSRVWPGRPAAVETWGRGESRRGPGGCESVRRVVH